MKIPMLKTIIILFLFGQCGQTKRETIQNRSHIQLYYRDIGSNNGYYTYFDYVKISDYENNQLKVKQMVDLADKYLDTATSDKPISHVTFVGQPPNGELPPVGMKFFSEQAEYMIISFAFNTTFKENEKASHKVISIDFWKVGEAKYSFENGAMDSIIKLNEFINNKE